MFFCTAVRDTALVTLSSVRNPALVTLSSVRKSAVDTRPRLRGIDASGPSAHRHCAREGSQLPIQRRMCDSDDDSDEPICLPSEFSTIQQQVRRRCPHTAELVVPACYAPACYAPS